jgi:hypothetical protein
MVEAQTVGPSPRKVSPEGPGARFEQLEGRITARKPHPTVRRRERPSRGHYLVPFDPAVTFARMATRRELRHALSGARAQGRWPYFGRPQKRLLVAGIAMWIGALLPWVMILGQSLRAAPLALSWALWAGLMTLAGASVRWRNIATLSAVLGGGGAIYLTTWQATTLFKACLSTQCLPGPGLVLLLAAGVFALIQALGLFRGRSSS